MELLATLKDWQSLVGGVLAIVAAGVGGLFIVAQTKELRRQENDRRLRRHKAARAVMPLALSATCEYTKNCATVLRQILSSAGSGGIPTSPDYPSFPDLPRGVVKEFAEIIESSSNEGATALSDLLKDLQIFSSRLRSLSADLSSASSIITAHNIENNIADAAELYAKAETLFEYARGKTESVPISGPDAGRVFTALAIMGLHGPSQYLTEAITNRASSRAAASLPTAWYRR